MKSKNNFERLFFIVLVLILMYVFNGCTTKKKIDYKKNPHYPYVIERK